jgi:hypothetical protein
MQRYKLYFTYTSNYNNILEKINILVKAVELPYNPLQLLYTQAGIKHPPPPLKKEEKETSCGKTPNPFDQL